MTVYIQTISMDGSCIVSSLLSIIENFKDVIVNDSDLFFKLHNGSSESDIRIRMTFGDVLKISRNLYSAKFCCWPQQVVVHDSDSGEASRL